MPLTVVLALVAVTAWLGFSLRNVAAGATREANMGQQELLAGADALKAGGFVPSKEVNAATLADFRSAETHFSHAKAMLAQGVAIRLMRSVPFVGLQLNAADDLSDIGLHISRVGRILAGAAGANLTDPAASGKGAADPGQRILAILQAVDPRLAQLDAELGRVQLDRAKIPSSGLLSQLSASVAKLDARLSLFPAGVVANLRADIPGIQHLLGSNGAQTYLVLDQDPAELRGTGGFVGTVGFLSFDHGKMAPFEAMDIDRIDTDAGGRFVLGGPGASNHVDPPYPLEAAFHLPSWELRDGNWSPDFPTAASQSEFLLQREVGTRVAGVIAIDPYLIERLLTITGPVKIPETGDVVDQHNFFALTFNRSELDYSAHRKDFIAQASKQIISRVLSLPSSQWPAVLDAIRWGCETRSLQGYFHDPQAEALSNRHHCGGQVQAPPGDALMVVEANVGGNKDDFWMKRSYDLQIAVSGDGRARHTLKLHYFDLTSHGDLTGPYRGWLRIYLPPSSSVVAVNGAKLDQSAELGRAVLQGWFYVQFNQPADVTVTYDESALTTTVDRHFMLSWQKQAGLLAIPITVAVAPADKWKPTGTTARGETRGSGTISTDLSVDRQFTFTYDSP